MLDAGDVGKFVGVALAGRWTFSSRFASGDAVVAMACSRFAVRASEGMAIAAKRAGTASALSRSAWLARGTSSHHTASLTTAIEIATSVCANAQRRA